MKSEPQYIIVKIQLINVFNLTKGPILLLGIGLYCVIVRCWLHSKNIDVYYCYKVWKWGVVDLQKTFFLGGGGGRCPQMIYMEPCKNVTNVSWKGSWKTILISRKMLFLLDSILSYMVIFHPGDICPYPVQVTYVHFPSCWSISVKMSSNHITIPSRWPVSISCTRRYNVCISFSRNKC